MKVLKRGTIPTEWSAAVECDNPNGCKAEILLAPEDVYSHSEQKAGGYGGDGYTETTTVWKCCECGRQQQLDSPHCYSLRDYNNALEARTAHENNSLDDYLK